MQYWKMFAGGVPLKGIGSDSNSDSGSEGDGDNDDTLAVRQIILDIVAQGPIHVKLGR